MHFGRDRGSERDPSTARQNPPAWLLQIDKLTSGQAGRQNQLRNFGRTNYVGLGSASDNFRSGSEASAN